MYYLKCNNCGHLNEVKSEFLTFCTQCNRKFENSFAAWKQKNPAKTFDDYLKEICIGPDAGMANTMKSLERKPFSVKLLVKRITGVFFALLIVMIIGFFGKQFLHGFFDKPLDELLKKEWNVQSCGSSGLNIESPVVLKVSHKLMNKIDPETRKFIAGIESCEGRYSNNFDIIMNSVSYVQNVETSLRGAANGAVNEMRAQPGVTNFVYTETQVERSGITGVLQSGSFNLKGKQFRFYDVIFLRGQQSWQVIIVFNATEKAGEQIALRIVESIAISEHT
jgi:hypothetical protein